MKKRICMMVVAFMMVLSIPVEAAIMRGDVKQMYLTFTGTTANCTLFYNCQKSTDTVSAEVDLMHNGTSLQHWSPSGTGSLALSETVAVEKGKTYTLVAVITVNGEKQNPVSISKTCNES